MTNYARYSSIPLELGEIWGKFNKACGDILVYREDSKNYKDAEQVLLTIPEFITKLSQRSEGLKNLIYSGTMLIYATLVFRNIAYDPVIKIKFEKLEDSGYNFQQLVTAGALKIIIQGKFPEWTDIITSTIAQGETQKINEILSSINTKNDTDADVMTKLKITSDEVAYFKDSATIIDKNRWLAQKIALNISVSTWDPWIFKVRDILLRHFGTLDEGLDIKPEMTNYTSLFQDLKATGMLPFDPLLYIPMKLKEFSPKVPQWANLEFNLANLNKFAESVIVAFAGLITLYQLNLQEKASRLFWFSWFEFWKWYLEHQRFLQEELQKIEREEYERKVSIPRVKDSPKIMTVKEALRRDEIWLRFSMIGGLGGQIIRIVLSSSPYAWQIPWGGFMNIVNYLLVGCFFYQYEHYMTWINTKPVYKSLEDSAQSLSASVVTNNGGSLSPKMREMMKKAALTNGLTKLLI
jgi:hypothetical protein